MLFSGARGRRIDSVLQAKKSLQLGSLAELPTPDVGAEALASAYDRLFQELIDHQAVGEGKRRSFAVTSALEEEGRSSIVANLAMAAARRGFSVLVIDADLRKPVQHLLLGGPDADPAPGLTDLLVGASTSPTDVLRETPIDNIRLLSIGSVDIESPTEMFASRAMERFVLNVAPRLADIVLFDAPHLLSNEPGRRILQYVDGVLYAVRLGSTDVTRAKRGLEKLAQAGARVIGGIFVPKGYFDLSDSVPVPGRATGVEKLEKNAETVKQTGIAPDLETEKSPESAISSAETDEKPMSNVTEAAEKPVAEASVGGMDDLESVLQGWRRRGTAEVAPATFETRPNVPEAKTSESEAATETPVVAPLPAVEAEAVKESESETIEERPAPFLFKKPIFLEEIAKLDEARHEEAKPEEAKPEAIEAKVEPVAETVKEEPKPQPIVAPIVEAPKPETIVAVEAPKPEPVALAPEPKAEPISAPIVEAPAPMPIVPVAVAPVAAPVAAAPVAPVVNPISTPVAVAPVAARGNLQELDVQIDMFPTAPGEMTMRAVTSNAAAAGIPNIVLEMTTQMHAMRGMRAITPSSGDPDAPRIALEASTTDIPDAAKMRILVGEGADAAFEAVLKSGEIVSVRTGGGASQPPVRLEIHNDKTGGATVRATIEGNATRQEVILELKREALTDTFSDAKWRNRVSIFSAAKI